MQNSTTAKPRLQVESSFPDDADFREYPGDDPCPESFERGDPFALVIEFTTHRRGEIVTNADLYAPPLRVRYCRKCGQQFLRAGGGTHLDLWLETTDDAVPWIELKALSLVDFFWATNVRRVHGCNLEVCL